MTQIDFEPYMEQFTTEQLEFFQGFPMWVQGTWAMAVWLSVAGSIFLLLRSRFAEVCFGLSLIFMAATFVHNFILSDVKMNEIAGPEALWFTAAIIVVAILLWIYARWMRQKGVLE
jgi:phosphatidylserine synthase